MYNFQLYVKVYIDRGCKNMRLRDRFIHFMQGRYGVDQFSKFLSITAIIILLISSFTRSSLLNLLGMVIFIYAYIRIFSKDINKRYGQNQKYLFYADKVKKNFRGIKTSFSQRKTHKIFKCPNCSQKIRVPKGKGKIEISCPKCFTKFVRKS